MFDYRLEFGEPPGQAGWRAPLRESRCPVLANRVRSRQHHDSRPTAGPHLPDGWLQIRFAMDVLPGASTQVTIAENMTLALISGRRILLLEWLEIAALSE